MVFISSIGYHVCIMLLKYTFLLQYRRFFPLPKFQRLCDIFLAFLSVWAVAGLVGAVTVCLPVSKNWDLREPIWACTQRFWFWLGYGIVHVTTDVLILIMPLPLLGTLSLPPLQKVVLMGVFCLGFVFVPSKLSGHGRLLTLTFSQDVHHIRDPPHHPQCILPGPGHHLDVGEDCVLDAGRSGMLDCVPLYTDTPSAFGELLLFSTRRGECHGARGRAVWVLWNQLGKHGCFSKSSANADGDS
jgi:hypothetical protein